MSSGPKIAPLPIIDLGPGAQVVFEAIDPTTGNTVAGVTVYDVTIYGRQVDVGSGPVLFDPVYLESGAI